jgi:hypothetical protein
MRRAASQPTTKTFQPISSREEDIIMYNGDKLVKEVKGNQYV